MTAKDPPKHPDTEQTLDEILARIQTVLAYLDSFGRADFQGAEERMGKLDYLGNITLRDI